MDHTGLKPGFSLVELMVTIALVAIVLGIGVAYLNGPQAQLKSAAFALRSAMQRTEFAAVKRNRNAYMDFTANGGTVTGFTEWVDNNGDGAFNAADDQTLDAVTPSSRVAFGSVPQSAGGPATAPPGGTSGIPAAGVSFSTSGNALRVQFSPDGTSSTGVVYLWLANQPSAGTYAVVLNSLGHAKTWYFRTGDTSWKER